MTAPPGIRVSIGRRQLDVALCEDADTTRRLAEDLSQRLRAIEDEEGTVDSHLSVLRLAYELATEIHRLGQTHAQETRDTIAALDRAATRLERLSEPD